MVTCTPPSFALQPSRVVDASSYLCSRVAGILRYLLVVTDVALVRTRAGQVGESSDVVWLLLVG
jgi:hypothetical protein